VQVMGDPDRLQQVVWNLLVNAIKFTPAGKSVAIQCQWIDRPFAEGVATTESLATAVRIIVRDFGPGIPEDMLKAAMQPFFRLEQSRNRETGGTGLGLAIAQQLAGTIGGAVRLYNRDGGGLAAEVVIR